MNDRRVLGRWVWVAAGAILAGSPVVAQTPARVPSQGPSSDLNTENREVTDEQQPRRYEVYDPGAGYGRSLYLNDQYFLPANPQGETTPNANRSGVQAHRAPRPAGEATQTQPREPAAPPVERIRGELVRVQTAPATDERPAGTEVVLKTEDGAERAFWLGDDSYVPRRLPTLATGDRATIMGTTVTADGDRRFDVRALEAPAGRFEAPYYRFNQAVEAKLISTRTEAGESDKPDVVMATIEMRDGRRVDAALGTPAELAAAGVTPTTGATVRIEGFLRSTGGEWSFVVRDVKVDGQSVRTAAAKAPAEPAATAGEGAP